MPKVEIIKRPIEQISGNLKKSAWMAVIGSLLLLIMGVIFIAWPDVSVLVVANILGAVFIINGIYRIINYFVMQGQNDFFDNGLLVGVVSVLVGIAAIVMGDNIASIFRVIIGILMVYEALVRANTAIKLAAAGIKTWPYILIIAVIMMGLGIFVTFNSGAVMQLIGWMMVITGAIGIVGDAMFIQQVNTVVDKITNK